MSAPFVTLTSGRIREGRSDDYLRVNGEITARVEAEEPRVIAFHVLLDEAGDRFMGMQFHPDPQSLEFHMTVVADLIAQAREVLDIESFTVLGPTTESLDHMLRDLAAAGVAVSHFPHHVNGFTRSSAEATSPPPGSQS